MMTFKPIYDILTNTVLNTVAKYKLLIVVITKRGKLDGSIL